MAHLVLLSFLSRLIPSLRSHPTFSSHPLAFLLSDNSLSSATFGTVAVMVSRLLYCLGGLLYTSLITTEHDHIYRQRLTSSALHPNLGMSDVWFPFHLQKHFILRNKTPTIFTFAHMEVHDLLVLRWIFCVFILLRSIHHRVDWSWWSEGEGWCNPCWGRSPERHGDALGKRCVH